MATIYIDPTVSGTGTGTFSDPYKSWGSVTFVAGNEYLQKGGTTFNGGIKTAVSGTATAQIIIGAYDGATGLRVTGGVNRARINGATSALPEHYCIFLNTASWVTIDNLELFDSGLAPTPPHSNLTATAIVIGNSTNNTVSNCYIHDVRVTPGSVGNEDHNGIQMFGSFHRVINNVIDNIPCDGVWFRGSNNLVEGNRISRVSYQNDRGDCIQGSGISGTRCDFNVIRNNFCDHRAKAAKQAIFVGGISGGNWTAGNVADSNVCLLPVYDGVTNTTCIYMEGTDCVVRNNVCRGGYAGIYAHASGNRITGNVMIGQDLGYTNTPGVLGTVLVNNYISGATNFGIYAFGDTTAVFQNNVVVNCSKGIFRDASATENFNAFGGNVVNNSNLALGANDIVTDVRPFVEPDGSLKTGDNPLATAGTYRAGVTLANGRLRPGFVPIGAYMAVLPRTART
jgi:parallel beta-helix repeat protein